VHFYLLEEAGEITLVDAGLSGYRNTLEPPLASAGRSIEDVKAIVLTHADPDHVGFAGELQSTHGIPVYVHRADSDRTREGQTKKTQGSPLDMLAMLTRQEHAPSSQRPAPSDDARPAVPTGATTALGGQVDTFAERSMLRPRATRGGAIIGLLR